MVPVDSIAWCGDRERGGLWYPPHDGHGARIELGREEGIDLVYHEAFHSVWHDCPLAKFDPWWGEGFCNAFSETMRNCYFDYHVPEVRPLTQHERNYLHPCYLLCHKALFDPSHLRYFFLRMNAEAQQLERPVLSEFFQWSPDPSWTFNTENPS
ncbi:MAG: hypothetical protein HOO67_01550 [Candidatus Peribacteraceae bacterium]|nr:hypothetical protein [Candidatus Peribacteraceae bacterium]